MNRRVEWAKQALKSVSRTDLPTRRNILKAIDEFAEENKGDVRRLSGSTERTYRLRVGGWRVIFSYLHDGSLFIERVGPRGDVYKR